MPAARSPGLMLRRLALARQGLQAGRSQWHLGARAHLAAAKPAALDQAGGTGCARAAGRPARVRTRWSRQLELEIWATAGGGQLAVGASQCGRKTVLAASSPAL